MYYFLQTYKFVSFDSYFPISYRFSHLFKRFHCVVSVRLRNKCAASVFFGPGFPAFRLITEIYTEEISVFGLNAGKCGPQNSE